jgi:hypothetical protein
LYFQVEAIIASRMTDEGRLFLVQWKGWPEDQNSWEPEDNLKDSTEELNQYLKIRNGNIRRILKVKKVSDKYINISSQIRVKSRGISVKDTI